MKNRGIYLIPLLCSIALLMHSTVYTGSKSRKPIKPSEKCSCMFSARKPTHNKAQQILPKISTTISQQEKEMQQAILASLKSVQPKVATSTTRGNHNRKVIDSHPLSTVIYEPVPQQKGADCGYHALYNAWRKYQQFNRCAVPTFPLEQWRTAIIQRRNASMKGRDTSIEWSLPSHGAWLDDGEIEFLARYSRIGTTTCTIIPSIVSFDEFLQDLSTVKRDLLREEAVHAFVLGNGRRIDDTRSTLGHWIAIVVCRKQGTLYYYVMDSLNGKPYTMVNALKKILGDNTPTSSPMSDQPDRHQDSKSPSIIQRTYQQVKRTVTSLKNNALAATKTLGKIALTGVAVGALARVGRYLATGS